MPIVSDLQWTHITTNVLPNYGIYEDTDSRMLTCIHPIWDMYAKDPKSKLSTLVTGLKHTQRITLHPPSPKGKVVTPITLVNCHGSRDKVVRTLVQEELDIPNCHLVTAGDINATYLLSQSTTITARDLLWPFLEQKTGQVKSLTSSGPLANWIDCWTVCQPNDPGTA